MYRHEPRSLLYCALLIKCFELLKHKLLQITIGPAILALIRIHYFRLLLHCIKTEQVMHMNLQYQFLDLAPSHSNGFI